MVLVSIVIPTFNRKDILKQTLESLIEQTFKDFEVVIADDGSSDGTDQMLSAMDVPFRVTHSWQPNAGRSAARNRGVSLALGSIILFMDDHVYADRRLVEEHVMMHRQFTGTSTQVVRGDAPLVRDKVDIPVDTPYVDMKTFVFKNEQNPFVSFFTGNVSMTRQAFDGAGGFDEDFKEYGFQDSEFGYRLVKAGFRIKVNPNALLWVVSARLSLEKRLDKFRQAGHSAVVLFRKNFWLGIYVGLNPFNLVLYWIFTFYNRFLLKKLYISPLSGYAEGSPGYERIVARIRYYHFLWGMYEKFFNTRSLKDYYEKKNTRTALS